ncbi:MAG TPA: pyrimidine/purine nucleoside phosphorylase [Rhodocyclaceae bacterium]|nr:pyrimidine/purine nucleoside phosphorylase [Rhodocyclaceae bacterium]HRQ46429.1 pyrimidine/purine nucleoside phosphorylase [Rhodocyclaceae bacterium]
MSVTEMFDGVTLTTRANVYFDGKCVSHGFVLPDGARKSVGVVLPGRLTFGTAAPEIMECVAGGCRVRMAAETDWRSVVAGESFAVPADSSFEIEVVGEPFHYICHYG